MIPGAEGHFKYKAGAQLTEKRLARELSENSHMALSASRGRFQRSERIADLFSRAF